MDKGVSAVHNVRTLRDGETAGLTVTWNWLYGFPGETMASYEPVIRQLSALVHLQPPLGVARICLERFSPHFDNPALGFAERTTAASYRHVYNLSEAELSDMVYLFDTPPSGLTPDQAAPLRELAAAWNDGYYASTLSYEDDGTAITIEDRRVGWPPRDHSIIGSPLREAYLELEHGHTATGLLRRLAERGVEVGADELRVWLAELLAHGLVFEESERFVTLAVPTQPIKLSASA